jgi:hypothetical protein
MAINSNWGGMSEEEEDCNSNNEKNEERDDIKEIYDYMDDQFRKVHIRIDRLETNQSDMNLIFNVIKGGGVLPYEFSSIPNKKALRKERYNKLLNDDDNNNNNNNNNNNSGNNNTNNVEEEEEDEDANSTSSSQAEHTSYCPFYFTCCGCTTQ